MSEPARAGQAAPVDDAVAALETWVGQNFGIRYVGDQHGLFAGRIAALARDLNVPAVTILTRVVSGDRTTIVRLGEAVSTNHTLFFREDEIFDYLATELVPRLSPGPCRVWSAATSSGDEAYSLAITFLEAWGPSAAGRVRILGTDLSERQVRAAETAVYPQAQLQRLSADRRKRWFHPAGLGQFAVGPEARALCTFRRLNLTQSPWPFEQRFHLIFLRNVLYYFEPALRRKVVEACFDAAEPGAWLVTSLTEPMLDLTTRWTAVRPAVFRRGPG